MGRVQEAMEHLQLLGDDFIEKTSKHNRGLILSLKALVESHAGRYAEEYAQEALKFLEPWDSIALTSVMNTLGKAYFLNGKINDALETYERACTIGDETKYTLIKTLVLMNYGNCLNAVGRCDEAYRLFTKYIEDMRLQFGKLLPMVGIIYVAISEIYYEKNEIAKAVDYLNQGIKLCDSFHILGFCLVYIMPKYNIW
jgi:tetratricopeptide (TPR) repeat protein